MPAFRLATVAINQIPLDWSGNRARITAAFNDFLNFAHRPDVVLFPELCVSGYGCEDAFHSEDVARRSYDSLRQIAKTAHAKLPGTLVAVGLPVRRDDRIYNCTAFLRDGRVQGLVPKRNLAGDGVHYEPRWFVADRDLHQREYHDDRRSGSSQASGAIVPFGPLLIEHRGVRIAVEICEDAWVARRPALLHLKRGVEIILNPNASHFAFDKYKVRRQIALESSRALSVIYAQVNLLGCEAGRMIYDGHSIVAAGGEALLENGGFSFADHIINEVPLDLNRSRVHRSRFYSHLDQADPESEALIEDQNPIVRLDPPESQTRAGARSPATRIGFESTDAGDAPDTEQSATPARSSHVGPESPSKELQFLYATTLGLFDYLRKSHSKGFVISLSGGADSAACAILVQRMFARAVDELGAKAALDRLGRTDLWKNLQLNDPINETVAQISKRMLFTIYQGTDQSSETTRSAAAAIALATGSAHSEVQVQELMDGYRKRLEENVLGRKLDWDTDDLALQNIQARVRSPMAWMLANTTGSLLITTSNRSEAAVGYATMDGDTSGGLAPIAGVDKAFVQHWLRFMESTGDPLLGPIPELSHITAQAPTAELRPLEQKQTDESDLMPYPLLDEIEKLAIRDRKSPAEVLEILCARHSHESEASRPDPETLRVYVRRFFELWSRNQWKRERYAPAFHLDDLNLDPRTWCRFPILSGAYADELRELMRDSAANRSAPDGD
ncbi:MAG: NAD(+) synthase [bacterium]|nr:NAD(+) synthase [bacterium]